MESAPRVIRRDSGGDSPLLPGPGPGAHRRLLARRHPGTQVRSLGRMSCGPALVGAQGGLETGFLREFT